MTRRFAFLLVFSLIPSVFLLVNERSKSEFECRVTTDDTQKHFYVDSPSSMFIVDVQFSSLEKEKGTHT